MLVMENVHKKYGQHSFGPFTLRIRSGESMAILGPNGAGKSTLLKLLTREEKPTSGKIVVGGDDAGRPEDVELSAATRASLWAGVAALRAGGRIVYWSVGDDPGFVSALRRAALDVQTLHVRAHATAGPMHTLYVATPRRG